MGKIAKPKSGKLFVQLAAMIDDFKFQQLSYNARIDELTKPHGDIYYEVESIIHAREICMNFIARFHINGNNWIGGRIVDENFNFICRVSYNGRIWDSDFDNNLPNEIMT